ncbi:hypothetical protein RMATCC62417_17725 [Rhizopus microsporus]|nr:hypothetical protein RMATCC62417_17725 [Rhizopus microsporus]
MPRFSIRYDENDDICPKNKNRQAAEPCQAADRHRKEKVLQVDCKPYWENYLDDSSNRECLAAYTLSADGFGKEFEVEQSELGINLSNYGRCDAGVSLVDGIKGSKQRITNSQRKFRSRPRHKQPKIYRLRRHVRLRLGHKLRVLKYTRFLECNRKRRFHQCMGAENDPLCVEVTRIKKPKFNNIAIQRQQDSVEIC